nr:glucose-6-phosphate isomerase [Bacillus piscicola]
MDYSNALPFIDQQKFFQLEEAVGKAHMVLHNNQTEKENEYLGWIDLPYQYDQEEFASIQLSAEKIKQNSDVLLVIGVGGSYLGAKAAIDSLSHSFRNQLKNTERGGPEVYFVGHHFSQRYIQDVLDLIENKDISINVISKSGTTTEPAIAFRIFRDYIEKKYGADEAAKRIYATTDKEKGALKKLADEKGYTTFTVPKDVGGRYSILTAVGLLPMAVAGLDIKKMMEGAKEACNTFSEIGLTKNDAYQYAALRYSLYRQGKMIEMLVNYEPKLHFFSEWWKQLFAESEGKDGKGIFPVAAGFSTDLHSIGQYIQDGHRHLFETVLHVTSGGKDIFVDKNADDVDGLNYLAGHSLDYINKQAFSGALLAHTDGGVPNLIVEIPELDEYYFGYLIYFFKKACAVSGLLLGVNPFDQPGVEAYKNNMFALLGKPGFEQQRKQLEKRLQHIKE